MEYFSCEAKKYLHCASGLTRRRITTPSSINTFCCLTRSQVNVAFFPGPSEREGGNKHSNKVGKNVDSHQLIGGAGHELQ